MICDTTKFKQLASKQI